MIGVLGGMGPLATADFYTKLVRATPATRDQDHLPVLIHGVPQVPDRSAAIAGSGPSPLPALLAARGRLLAAGATLLAMPCNTAHHWYDALVADCPAPFLHIVDAVHDAAAGVAPAGGTLAIVSTRGTRATGLYERRLAARGWTLLHPTERELDEAVMPAIAHVKAGAVAAGGALLLPVLQALLDRGADAVVLACTETPVALAAVPTPLAARCVDSTGALALATVRAWQRRTAVAAGDGAR